MGVRAEADEGHALSGAGAGLCGVAAEGAEGETALCAGCADLGDGVLEGFVVTPKHGREVQRQMEVVGADEDHIDAGDIKDLVEVLEGLDGLDLDADEDLRVRVGHISGPADAEAKVSCEAAAAALASGREAGEADGVTGLLRVVDHGDNDALGAAVEGLFDVFDGAHSDASQGGDAALAHV